MALKIELKPNERVILGECFVTNAGPRTRLVIDGVVPILREKDIMRPERADSPAKCIYLAVQRMYTAKHPRRHHALDSRLVRNVLQAAPDAQPFLESINNQILMGDLYKALKEARKLIAYENKLVAYQKRSSSTVQYASNAYAKAAKETASPRALEASLLLKAAAQLQAVYESWKDKKPPELSAAVLYNRRLWTVFIDAVMSDDNKLPVAVRRNIANLGTFVMGETFSLMTQPKPDHLTSLIKINRGIAAGLRDRA